MSISLKKRFSSLRSNERGFTIIEVMVAALLLVIGSLAVLKMLDTSNAVANATQARSQANAVARSIIESSRSLQYGQLSSSAAVETALKSLPSLADDDTSDPAWTIKQRNTTYTVSVFTLCTVDDQLDGYGDHTGGSYCSDSSTQGTDDANPDDYKRLTIRLSWTDSNNASKAVRQTTLINNPGAGAGPSIRAGFAMTTPACGVPPANADTAPQNCRIVATSPETDQATFTLATADPARTVDWSVENVFQGNGTPAGSCGSSTTCSDWTFIWSFGCLSQSDLNAVCFDSASSRIPTTVDGTYLVGATAIDENNNAGPPRALTITLNRRTPGATPGFIAGWNGTNVDFEWLANADNDLTRYRVFRVVGSPDPTPGSANDVTVCDLTPDGRDCTDSSPGAVGTSPQYYVAAYDLNDSGAERVGAASAVYTADPTNTGPTVPTSFACSPCTGVVSFTWTASTDSDGTVAFYRIYRTDTTAPPTSADRYGRTVSNTASFQDSDTGTARYYWVSAVDDALAESAVAGPLQAGG